MAMTNFREIYILKSVTLLHVIIIISAKLSGVLLCNEFLSQFHNGSESHRINGVVKHLFDATICLKEDGLPKYKWNRGVSKVIMFE